MSWKNILNIMIIIGFLMVVYGVLESDYVSSEFLANPNASWHFVEKFPNENRTHNSGPIEIRGYKYKVKVNATFKSDEENSFFNMTWKKGFLIGRFTPWPMEELYVTPSPNTNNYSEEFIRNNFILFGTDRYSFNVEENNVKNWSIEIYDYY